MSMLCTLKRPEKVVIILTALLLFFKTAWLVYFIDCGIDMTDEAHALHLIKHYAAYPQVFHEFHFLLGKMFWFIPVTAVNMRWLNYAFEIVSALWLGAAVYFYLNKYKWWESSGEKTVFVFLSFCALFASTIYQSISYYQFTNFNVYITVGSLLFISTYGKRGWYLFFLCLLAGITCALQFFIKFTSSLLLLVYAMAFCLKFFEEQKLKASIVFVFAFALTFVSVIASRGGWSAWLQDYEEGYRLLKLITYSNLDIVWRVYIQTDLVLNIRLLWLPVLLFWIVNFKRFSVYAYTNRIFVVWLFSIVWIFLLPQFISLQNPPYNLGLGEYRILNCIVITLLALGLIIWHNAKGVHLSVSFMVATLLLLPLVCFVGSDTPLSDMVYESIFPWGILGAIFGSRVLIQCAEKPGTFIVYFWIILWGIQFISFRYKPYYLQQNIFEQRYTVPGLEQIKTDSATRDFIGKIYGQLKPHGYKPLDEVVALHNMPGVVYLLDAFTQATIFFYPKMDGTGNEEYKSYTCEQIAKMQFKGRFKKPYFLLSSDVVAKEVDCIRNMNVGFPENYIAVDTLYNPSIKKWVVLWFPQN